MDKGRVYCWPNSHGALSKHYAVIMGGLLAGQTDQCNDDMQCKYRLKKSLSVQRYDRMLVVGAYQEDALWIVNRVWPWFGNGERLRWIWWKCVVAMMKDCCEFDERLLWKSWKNSAEMTSVKIVTDCRSYDETLVWTWWKTVVNMMKDCCEFDERLLWIWWKTVVNIWKTSVNFMKDCCEFYDRLLWIGRQTVVWIGR